MDLIDELAKLGVVIESEDYDPYSEVWVYHLIEKLQELDPFTLVVDVRELMGNLVDGRRAWITAGECMIQQKDFHSGLLIFEALLDRLSSPDCLGCSLKESNGKETRTIPYKADCLRGIATCHRELGRDFLANRAIILALIDEGACSFNRGYVEETGDVYTDYELLAFGFSKEEIEELRTRILELKKSVPESMTQFPEYVLQLFNDYSWLKRYPTSTELLIYKPNKHYLKALLDEADKTNENNEFEGNPFEFLAEYLFQLIPGCRASRREITHETDLDIWCQFDGVMHDFRKELGHYWLVECKNWKNKAGFTEIAKFALVLISVDCKFGVMFSREGISAGQGGFEDATRAVVKLYQNARVVIAVINRSDLNRILSGESLINLLQNAYEQVRFDFPQKK